MSKPEKTMSDSNSKALTEKSAERILAKERKTSIKPQDALDTSSPSFQERPFPDQAVLLHQAIEDDREAIDIHLETLQRELEKGMDQVAEVKDRAVEIKDEAQLRLHYARQRLEHLKDWKQVVRRHPWETVGVSLAAGFVLGSMLYRS